MRGGVGRNETERDRRTGRGRKYTAVTVAIGANHPLQQVKALSQRAEALEMCFSRNSGTGPGLGRVSGVLCHSAL